MIAHGKPLGVGDRGESVHLAAVDLLDLLVVAMNEVGDLVRLLDVLVDQEGTIRQIGGKARIGTGRLLVGIEGRRQRGIGFAVAIDLTGGGARLRPAVRTRKITEQIVEAVILKIDDDDMLEALEPLRGMARPRSGGAALGGGRGRASDDGEDGASDD